MAYWAVAGLLVPPATPAALLRQAARVNGVRYHNPANTVLQAAIILHARFSAQKQLTLE